MGCIGLGSAVSDLVDGPVARYFEKKGYVGSISEFGKGLDRFRDKDFVITIFLFITWHPMMDQRLKWLFWTLIIAEVVLLITLFVAVKRKVDASATNWGKYKMFLECVVSLIALVIIAVRTHGIIIPAYVTCSVAMALLVTLFFAIMSIKGHMVGPRRLPSSHSPCMYN